MKNKPTTIIGMFLSALLIAIFCFFAIVEHYKLGDVYTAIAISLAISLAICLVLFFMTLGLISFLLRFKIFNKNCDEVKHE